MSKKIAIILSGCGVFDGSEIYESVLTLLRLEQNSAQYECFAPNINQHHVINHLTGEEMPEQRNVLVEAARLARGEIKNISELSPNEMDALIIPGGFGAAKNLSDFAFKGEQFTINDEVKISIEAFHKAGKPIGLICIAPAMAGKIFGHGVKCTIGKDPDTAAILEKTGAIHIACNVDDIVVDENNKLVTTPAYMLGQSISEVAVGINKLVDKVLVLS